jgi:hypothetical protein
MDSPKIPTLKDSQKPQVKVRGLEAGVTLFDRLKQFKKKDLAFILAGLGTLFMAPLAEHFMMAPETGSDLQAGMGGKGGGNGSGLFNGDGRSPYETTGGLAQGSPSGGGSDIITPLNVRDPSALVMGPGATQQPPTQSVAPSTPPPTAPVANKDSDLRDALAASARGIGSAAKAAKALLPVPKVALQGAGGLRGLGVVSGGSSAVGGPIASSNSLGKANTGGGGLGNVRALPGFKGVARGPGQGGSGYDNLKAQADKMGDRMNQGSAAAALDAAANTGIPSGGASGLGGNGAGGTGGTDKPDSGNQDKSAKSVGESLDFLKQKAIQEAKIALWAKEQEANDMNLQMANMRNDALKTIVGAMATSIGTCAGNLVTGGTCVDPTKSSGGVKCEGGANAGQKLPAALMVTSCDKVAGGSKFILNGIGEVYACPGGTTPWGTGCHTLSASDSSTKSSSDQTGGNGVVDPSSKASLPTAGESDALTKNLGTLCGKVETIFQSKGGATGGMSDGTKKYLQNVVNAARQTIVERDALYNGDSKECTTNTAMPPKGVDPIAAKDGTVVDLIKAAAAQLASNAPDDPKTAVGAMYKSVPKTDGDPQGADMLKAGSDKLTQAATLYKAIQDRLAVPPTTPVPTDEFIKWFPGGAAAEKSYYDQPLIDAQAALAKQNALVGAALNGGNGGYEGMTIQVTNLNAIITGAGSTKATLPQVIQTNGQLKTAVASAPDEVKAKAAATPAATDANATTTPTTGTPTTGTPTTGTPTTGTPTTGTTTTGGPTGVNQASMQAAIDKATSSIQKGANSDPGVVNLTDAITAYKGTQSPGNLNAAATALQTAQANVKAMDDSQTGWLTQIQGQVVKAVSILPAKGAGQ